MQRFSCAVAVLVFGFGASVAVHAQATSARPAPNDPDALTRNPLPLDFVPVNVPVHGIVTSFADAIAAIEKQVQRARAFCAGLASDGYFQAGCPVKYSRD